MMMMATLLLAARISTQRAVSVYTSSPSSPSYLTHVLHNPPTKQLTKVFTTSQSSTNSLSESIYKYRVFHGRTYNASKTSEYWAPNDEQQNEGLDMWHNSLLMMMDNKLFLAPIGDNVQRVLDVGTGTGIWAM